MENGKYKITVENRLTKVEEGLIGMKETLEEIKDNHLQHLASKVDRVQWILVTTLITLVVALILKLIQ